MAVLAPSLVLAWLAVRSLRDQQLVLERQQSLLYQGVADSLDKEVEAFLTERQHEFTLQVESLLAESSPAGLSGNIDRSASLKLIRYSASFHARITFRCDMLFTSFPLLIILCPVWAL